MYHRVWRHFGRVWLAVGAAALGWAQDVVKIPPLLVEASSAVRPWRYGETPEFEVLSRCSDQVTASRVAELRRRRALFSSVLPPSFQTKLETRTLLLIYDEESIPRTARDLAGEVRRAPGNSVLGIPPRLLRNPALFDLDVVAAFIAVPYDGSGDTIDRAIDFEVPGGRGKVTRSQVTLAPGYLNFLTSRRTPPYPTWFTAGFSPLALRLEFAAETVTAPPMEWPKENKKPLPLLPLATFWELAGKEGALKSGVWYAQAELLVRWGLDAADPQRRASFLRLVEQAGRNPVSPSLFASCFGYDLREADNRLAAYRRDATRKSLTWRRTGMDSPLVLRDATTGEIARIKGEWERLATHYVRAKSPGDEAPYLELARRTLGRAYDKGDRDPRLLATMGLCELEAEEDAVARRRLEEAVSAGVRRPRAYLELARLRWAELQARKGATFVVAADEAATVTTLLVEARNHAPELAESYQLLATVLSQCANPPSADDLALIEDGLTHFPDDPTLGPLAAALFLKAGQVDRAGELVVFCRKQRPRGRSLEVLDRVEDQLRSRQ